MLVTSQILLTRYIKPKRKGGGYCMADFDQKGHFSLAGKTLRLNIEGVEYFFLLNDLFLVLAGAEEERPIFLHHALKADVPTISDTSKP